MTEKDLHEEVKRKRHRLPKSSGVGSIDVNDDRDVGKLDNKNNHYFEKVYNKCCTVKSSLEAIFRAPKVGRSEIDRASCTFAELMALPR